MADVVFIFVLEDKLPPNTSLMAFNADGARVAGDGAEVPIIVVLRDQLSAKDAKELALPKNISAYGIEHSPVVEDVIDEFKDKGITYKKLTSFSHIDKRPIYENVKVVLNSNNDDKAISGAISFFFGLKSDIKNVSTINDFSVLQQILILNKNSKYAEEQLKLLCDNHSEYFEICRNISAGEPFHLQIDALLQDSVNRRT